jgi:hypothetical protein
MRVNVDTTKYISMSLQQSAGQNKYVEVSRDTFENEANCKYLGTTLRDKNCTHEEI